MCSINSGPVQNDDNADWREAWALFSGNIAYVWHGGLHSAVVAEGLIQCGFRIRAQIIWNKDLAVFGRGDYHWKHEPCWYAIKNTGHWVGDRTEKTVWDVPTIHSFKNGRNAEEWELTGHGTQKPVELMRRPIRNHTVPGDAVYDPFLGSGTTMVAAEQLQRVCYGMEIAPEYCAVILERMSEMGLSPAPVR